MSSTFYGLQIAKTGLFASQKGLELTGHNISNTKTPGYSRQRLNLASIEGATTQSIILQATNGQVGGGVEVVNIEQIRDQFLDAQYRKETNEYNMWETKSDVMYYVEDIVREPSDSGLTSVLSVLYKSLQEFSKKPQDEDIRNLVRQNAITTTETINYYAEKLELLQKEQDDAIDMTASKANSLLNDIAALNLAIVKYELNGENANDLMDKRNYALDQLSDLVDITYKLNDRNMVSVYFGKDNTVLIDNTDDKVNEMHLFEISESGQSFYGKYNFHELSANGVTVNSDSISGGTLKGYFDMRDGDSASFYGLPYIMNQFDTLAGHLVKVFNDINKAGYSIPNKENGNVSQTGLDFFDSSKTRAIDMDISEALKQSVWNLAGSDKEVDLEAANTNEGNNINALKFAEISQTYYPDVGKIDDFLSGIVSEIGVQAEYANEMYDNQNIIRNSVEAQRQSVSGVSIDEEVTNVLTYQKSYNAAARVITAIDQMLDKLINGTGVVGL